MKELMQIASSLRKKLENNAMIYNYTIPQVWDTFGYEKGQRMRNHEMIINPYEFGAFALEAIAKQCKKAPALSKEKGKQGSWIKSQVLYDLDMRTLTSWDHDRNERIETRNLYGCNDGGTFYKAILLLPLLKRVGITTLQLHHLWALDEKRTYHDFSDPHAIVHPLMIDEALCDPMLEGYDAKAQLRLFVDVAHQLGFRVLCDCSIARMGRNNALLKEHPDWFYWIKKEAEQSYHAPRIPGLPKGCIPSKKVCRVLYQSEETAQHLANFVLDPHTQSNELFASCKTYELKEIEEVFGCTTAPVFSDQINSDVPLEIETTFLRFFEDQPLQKTPYVLQDTLRPDLFPGKRPNKALWQFLSECMCTYIQEFGMDGISIQEPWNLPRSLIKQIIQDLRKIQPHCAILLEDTNEQNAKTWQRIGVDLIYGASAYQFHESQNRAYHDFAYARPSAPSYILAASEFRDTPRITQYEGGEQLAKMRMFMNLFLPNVVPYIESGQLSLEQQPQHLSPFADQAFQNALPHVDLRSHKQAGVDRYHYAYTKNDYHVLINQLEKFHQFRKEYLPAITKANNCIPVWFDDPRDPGIGFTYPLKDSALLVVCNGDIVNHRKLTIHTENMLWELPFAWKHIHQIYSSNDPYVHEITCNEFQNIPMDFAPGEIKLLEIRGAKEEENVTES